MPGAQVDRVRVRMYRQGLGDSFLLTFSTATKQSHLLIDCGVFKGTEGATKTMRSIAESVLEVTGGRLDVLVATHEHWDHLSGFLQAGDVWAGLEVGAVWVAWTEDPDDDLAKELGARKARALQAAETAARKLQAVDTPGARSLAESLDALLGFEGDLGAAARGHTTRDAFDWVKGRQKPKPEYRRPGELLSDLPGLPGVRVYVLGPPHERSKIKRSDPSRVHSEVYELAGSAAAADLGFFSAVDALDREGQPAQQPFDNWFRVGDDEAREEHLFAEVYNGPEDWRRIEHDWLGVAGRLALQLDSDTNNTSLALAFELPGGKVLLFPGDAQVGNWLSWEELEWTLTDGGATRTVKVQDLLAHTVLYKVGHHASHNATLREKGLELMVSGDLIAMIPVGRQMANKKGWKMPFPPLYQRLYEKTNGRILDGDKGLDAAGIPQTGDGWDRFVARTDVQPGWIDYTIES